MAINNQECLIKLKGYMEHYISSEVNKFFQNTLKDQRTYISSLYDSSKIFNDFEPIRILRLIYSSYEKLDQSVKDYFDSLLKNDKNFKTLILNEN